MNKPFFSIIIPALNEEKYLPKLLKDLTVQSYKDFEVIVVDGKSEDKTVLNAQKLSTKLPSLKILSSSKRHVCVQRNLGAKNARADWLIFMDADNRIPSYFLQGIKYRLESDPTDIATCWLQNDQASTKDKSIAIATNYAHELMLNTPSPILLEALIISSKKAFNKIGGFDEKTDLAEGVVFSKQAQKKNLTYKIFKDPTYVYSLRRIRRFGVLKIANSLAQHELAKLLDIPLSKTQVSQLYPMRGGKLFDTPQQNRKRFTNRIQTIIKEFRSPENIKQKLQELLEN